MVRATHTPTPYCTGVDCAGECQREIGLVMTKKEVISCNCRKSVVIESSTNVGELATRSGYTPIFIEGPKLVWICPECKPRLLVHINAIRSFFGDDADDVSWYPLWKGLTR